MSQKSLDNCKTIHVTTSVNHGAYGITSLWFLSISFLMARFNIFFLTRVVSDESKFNNQSLIESRSQNYCGHKSNFTVVMVSNKNLRSFGPHFVLSLYFWDAPRPDEKKSTVGVDGQKKSASRNWPSESIHKSHCITELRGRFLSYAHFSFT